MTLRDRDSLEQERVPAEELADRLAAKLAEPWQSPKLGLCGRRAPGRRLRSTAFTPARDRIESAGGDAELADPSHTPGQPAEVS